MTDAVVEPVSDGRRARRERNRTAVIDAMFALLAEGHFPPSVDEVAERAGVSVSSVFRYFDSLDDLQQETIERYFERFAHLFVLPELEDGGLDDRIEALADARLDLWESIAPIGRMARARAGDQPRIAASLLDTRRFLCQQLRGHFAPDLRGRTAGDAEERVALVDTLTAFEAWDLLHATHEWSRPRIRRAWLTGIRAVLD